MSDNSRDNDIVVKQGEYCFILDESKAIVQVLPGPAKVSMSQTDSTVEFTYETKRFVKVPPKEAIKPFVTAPESYYVVLCNPTVGNVNDHPKVGTISMAPDLDIGKKIVIPGPCSFALFPGQMAKVIRGHRLSTNQYILCRTYFSKDTNQIGTYSVIKGTEKSFYIPPTGTEVVPLPNGQYVRNAVTLENLEYCILLNEEGEKKYIHGPAVVFPEPDEVFVTNKQNGSYKFRAIELSDISGLYIKVVADYDEEEILEADEQEDGKDGTVTTEVIHHSAGEELFITGKDQAIYYPRPEHMIISYGEDKQTHHAIAIPTGEGRYVLNRMTGEIRTVTGPTMFLPDPRYEVIVKRKLTKRQCEKWYPGNDDVLAFNGYHKEITVSNDSIRYFDGQSTLNLNTALSCTQGVGNLTGATKMGIERSNTYTPPRTITIDNKFDGVVTVNVWAGYAISIVDKKGHRRTVVGPQTVLLNYDEELETVNGDVYLSIANNAIGSGKPFTLRSKDSVGFSLDVAFNADYDIKHKDEWFASNNYVSMVVNELEDAIRKVALEVKTEDLIDNIEGLLCGVVDSYNKKNRAIHINYATFRSFVPLDKELNETIESNKREAIQTRMELESLQENATRKMEIAELTRKNIEIEHKNEMHRIELKSKRSLEEINGKATVSRAVEANEKAELEAKKEQETAISASAKIKLQREKDEATQKIALLKEKNKAEIERINAETEARKKLLDSITPNLVEAITTASKHETLREVTENLSPYLMSSSNGESVADVVDKLTRGTSLEGLLRQLVDKE